MVGLHSQFCLCHYVPAHLCLLTHACLICPSYECLDPSELKQLPVGELLPAEGPCIVAVWVTNNPAIASFVREQLFPAWHVQYLATWHWLKVCDDGEMVNDCSARTEREVSISDLAA